jgi:hypothetical protein
MSKLLATEPRRRRTHWFAWSIAPDGQRHHRNAHQQRNHAARRIVVAQQLVVSIHGTETSTKKIGRTAIATPSPALLSCKSLMGRIGSLGKIVEPGRLGDLFFGSLLPA